MGRALERQSCSAAHHAAAEYHIAGASVIAGDSADADRDEQCGSDRDDGCGTSHPWLWSWWCCC